MYLKLLMNKVDFRYSLTAQITFFFALFRSFVYLSPFFFFWLVFDHKAPQKRVRASSNSCFVPVGI